MFPLCSWLSRWARSFRRRWDSGKNSHGWQVLALTSQARLQEPAALPGRVLGRGPGPAGE